jgi:hypothetical protein
MAGFMRIGLRLFEMTSKLEVTSGLFGGSLQNYTEGASVCQGEMV